MQENIEHLSIARGRFHVLTGDYFSALVLGQFNYYQTIAKHVDDYIDQENARSAASSRDEGVVIPPTEGWFYKSLEELCAELLYPFKRSKASKIIQNLVDKGWLLTRENPYHKWDHIKQYRVNLVKLYQDLRKLGYGLPLWDPATLRLTEDEGAENQQSNSATRQSSSAGRHLKAPTDTNNTIEYNKGTPEKKKKKRGISSHSESHPETPQTDPSDLPSKSGNLELITRTLVEAFRGMPFEGPGKKTLREMVENGAITPEWAKAFAKAKTVFDRDRKAWAGKAYIPVSPGYLVKNIDGTRQGIVTVLTAEAEYLGEVVGQTFDETLIDALDTGGDYPEKAPEWFQLLYCYRHQLIAANPDSPLSQRVRANPDLLVEWLKLPGIDLSDEEIQEIFGIDYEVALAKETKLLDHCDTELVEVLDLIAAVK